MNTATNITGYVVRGLPDEYGAAEHTVCLAHVNVYPRAQVIRNIYAHDWPSHCDRCGCTISVGDNFYKGEDKDGAYSPR
jgi:hypothetical protein